MMVDPMFMIVQSLRSFLTAVTLTAVAPIAVRGHFRTMSKRKTLFVWLFLGAESIGMATCFV